MAETNTAVGRDVPVKSRTEPRFPSRTGSRDAEVWLLAGLASYYRTSRLRFHLFLFPQGDKWHFGTRRDLWRLFTERGFQFPESVSLVHLNMASTTCTRFTDEYQLYEELGK